MAYLEYFSPQRLALQREIAQTGHENLWPLLANHPPSEFEMRLAEIAAYCEVILDGVYSQEEIDKLCEILTRKLYEKRTGVIVINSLGVSK